MKEGKKERRKQRKKERKKQAGKPSKRLQSQGHGKWPTVVACSMIACLFDEKTPRLK